MSARTPSSGAARHLLPQGEKEEGVAALQGKGLPSPLAGEGARRAGEGAGLSTSKRLKTFSRTMRKNPTGAEEILWRILRDRRFANFKFRRQVPLGSYIADFVCYKARLIVELDGSQHAENLHDVARDNWLKGQGFEILRIWNNELANNRDSVLETIWNAVQREVKQ